METKTTIYKTWLYKSCDPDLRSCEHPQRSRLAINSTTSKNNNSLPQPLSCSTSYVISFDRLVCLIEQGRAASDTGDEQICQYFHHSRCMWLWRTSIPCNTMRLHPANINLIGGGKKKKRWLHCLVSASQSVWHEKKCKTKKLVGKFWGSEGLKTLKDNNSCILTLNGNLLVLLNFKTLKHYDSFLFF